MSRLIKRPAVVLSAICLLLAAHSTTVWADNAPSLRLSATVSSYLYQDELSLVFSAYSEASAAAAANERLIEVLNDAQAKLGKPVEVKISNGVLQTYPFRGKADEPTVWRGRGELILDSGNLPAVSQAADKLTDVLSLSRVNFSLSDEARRKEQSRLIEQAARAFREKAQVTAEAFGYDAYDIVRLEISNSGEVVNPRPMLMSRTAQADPDSSANLDLRPSQESVSVTVDGSVTLR
jgi:predicted secreted protein